MSADIINLRRARKRRQRQEAERTAAENRARFGQPGAERKAADAAADLASKRLEGHRIGSTAQPEPHTTDEPDQ